MSKKAPAKTVKTPPRSEWRVNGKKLPAGFEHLFAFEHTDQAIALAAKDPNRLKPSGITVGAEQFDKDIDRIEHEEYAPNPLVENMEGHTTPGFHHRWLGNTRVDQAGLRGYEVVKDEKGEMVKMGRMFLGRIPLKIRQKRARAMLQESADNLADAQSVMEQYDLGLKNGEMVKPYQSTYEGQDGDLVQSFDENEHTIGSRSTRGTLEATT